MQTSKDEITAICKRCRKVAPASSFVLDNVYKMMVCQDCVKERIKAKTDASGTDSQAKPKIMNKPSVIMQSIQKEPKEHIEHEEHTEHVLGHEPAGKTAEQIRPISPTKTFDRQDKQDDKEDTRIKYTCGKCKFKFTYSPERKYPRTCPNCNSAIFFVGGSP